MDGQEDEGNEVERSVEQREQSRDGHSVVFTVDVTQSDGDEEVTEGQVEQS